MPVEMPSQAAVPKQTDVPHSPAAPTEDAPRQGAEPHRPGGVPTAQTAPSSVAPAPSPGVAAHRVPSATVTAPSASARGPDSAPRPVSAERIAAPDPAGGEGEVPTVEAISIADIEANPLQPRQTFDATALQSLAESIRTAGVMQPIVVRPRPVSAAGAGGARYQIVAGERRWRAASLIGLARIPAIVRTVDDRTAGEWAIVENVQREDLNPMDRAAALRRLVDDYAVPQAELASRLGLDRSTVSNFLRLNDLDPFTSRLLREGRLTAGHGRALLGCVDAARRAELAAAAARGEWSVRRTEQAVAALAAARAAAGPTDRRGREHSPTALHVAALQKRLADALGTRVELLPGRSKGSGKLVIEYYSLDQFDGLLRRMGVAEDALREQ